MPCILTYLLLCVLQIALNEKLKNLNIMLELSHKQQMVSISQNTEEPLITLSGAHKRHKVVQRSIKLTRITGSNCCQMLLCAFYHLRIVLITEAIIRLQNKWLSTLGSLKIM